MIPIHYIIGTQRTRKSKCKIEELIQINNYQLPIINEERNDLKVMS